MLERDYIKAFDDIEGDIDEHISDIQDPMVVGLFNRIKQRIANVFHKTHVDEFAGEDMSRSFGKMYTRQCRSGDDGADTSHSMMHADGVDTFQPHTQLDT